MNPYLLLFLELLPRFVLKNKTKWKKQKKFCTIYNVDFGLCVSKDTRRNTNPNSFLIDPNYL